MKQGYSETEGKCYPLFFACKNDSLDVRIDGSGANESKRKTGAAGLSFFPFSGGGMVSDAVFLRLCRTVRVHGTGDPDGICCGCGWTEEGMESGGCDYLPERKYGGDTPDRGKERGSDTVLRGCQRGGRCRHRFGKTGDRECDRSSSLAWLWYRLAPAERNTLFLAVGAVMLFTIRQLWHGRKIMQENKL